MVKELGIDCNTYDIPGIVFIPPMKFDNLNAPGGAIWIEPTIFINKDDFEVMFPPKISIEFIYE